MTELAWIRGRCPWCDGVKLEAVEVWRGTGRRELVTLELLEESLEHLADAHSV